MDKRILNIAAFARIYFDELGKPYGNDRKQREAADKNFRRILSDSQVDTEVFKRAQKRYLAQLVSEISTLN